MRQLVERKIYSAGDGACLCKDQDYGGHPGRSALAWLRDRCPCAGCTGAHGTPLRQTDLSASPFQMYKPALKIASIEPVGNYALRIHWNDGHNSGIYSYDYLRKICPCEVCTGRIYSTPTGAGS